MGNRASVGGGGGGRGAVDGCSEGEGMEPGSGAAAPAPAPTAGVQYNVYNQVINPSNNMPLAANQLPWPGQRKSLSTARAVSTIPKGGSDSTWVFPSPQMFFNALQRKGKGDDVTEDDMDSVVSVHNGARAHARTQAAAARIASPSLPRAGHAPAPTRRDAPAAAQG